MGGGALGREICTYARELGWEVLVIVDDDPEAVAAFPDMPPVLGGLRDYDYPADHEYLIAVGSCGRRATFDRVLADRGGRRLATLVHPTAWVAPSAVLGEGSIVCPLALVAVHAVVGRNVLINTHASVCHDGRIGDQLQASNPSGEGGCTGRDRSRPRDRQQPLSQAP